MSSREAPSSTTDTVYATGNFTKIVQRFPVRIKVDPEVAREALLRPGLSVVARVDTRDRPAVQASR